MKVDKRGEYGALGLSGYHTEERARASVQRDKESGRVSVYLGVDEWDGIPTHVVALWSPLTLEALHDEANVMDVARDWQSILGLGVKFETGGVLRGGRS